MRKGEGLSDWSSDVLTPQQQQNHQVRGRLQLADVLLSVSVHRPGHHIQETLHQACLHQLQLDHVCTHTYTHLTLNKQLGTAVRLYDL